MKKQLLAFGFMIAALGTQAQSTRLSVFEEFTGETCPPCAATNPGLNALLSSPTNTPKVVALKWQVPIPSAPTNTWSLYQTNKTEINWRYGASPSGFGYNSPGGITSAPNGKMDGQNPVVFGAASDHPANLNNAVIATAQSYTTPFSINVTRAWDATFSSINLTVNISATSSFSATGNLICRVVMIERRIHFLTQPGTNGEKDFDDVVIKSFPSIQAGTPMAANWTNGQTQTFTLNCPVPSYCRDKSEIAMVAFIQDDATSTKLIWQAGVADKVSLANDAKAVSASLPSQVCSSTIAPSIVIGNNGNNAITAMTITPYIDGTAQTPVNITTNLGVGTTTTVGVGVLNVTGGAHTFSYNISGVSGGDFNTNNNSLSKSFVVVTNYQAVPVAEGFATTFPPANWSTYNNSNSPTWIKVTTCGGFGLSPESTKMDFYNISAGTVNDLNLPAMNLTGINTPSMTFDVAYASYSSSYADTLKVLVSTNCGATWSVVYNKAGTVLQTASPVTSAFTPSSAQWRKETVALTGLNTNSVLVKFVAISDFGNNLYIDNVNLRQTDAVGIENINASVLNIEMYPNPASSEVLLNIPALNAGNAKVSIVNTLGQVVYSNQSALNMGDNRMSIDVKDFAAGVYNVIIDTKDASAVKKLTVTK
ncbi:MAG TPA: choice-of-anchor J domain-containing protein [Bacteroidia bacterium]|nr:choice-of-anchor J domain-containing protein [Bacteroidia bacterium]